MKMWLIASAKRAKLLKGLLGICFDVFVYCLSSFPGVDCDFTLACYIPDPVPTILQRVQVIPTHTSTEALCLPLDIQLLCPQ